MLESIQQLLQSQAPSLVMIPAALLVGVTVSATSCCNVAVVGAIAGYSGSISGGGRPRREVVLAGISFMVGTVIALSVLGAIIGMVGSVAGAALGQHWKFVGALVTIFFGLATLKLVPFSLPALPALRMTPGSGSFASVLYGLTVGGASTACSVGCSVGCNPLFAGAMGLITVSGSPLWGAGILGAFAVGYSLPLAAGLIGLSLGLGKLRSAVSGVVPVLSPAAGVLMVGVGFYMLATL